MSRGVEEASRGLVEAGGLAIASRGLLLDWTYVGAAGETLEPLRYDARLGFDTEELTGDLGLEHGDLERDTTLATSVVLSLFSDARARDDDELPAGDTDRRGWWGDLLGEEGDRFGSRLWLLSREKVRPQVLVRARQYAREALTWVLEDRIAERVEVEAEFQRLPGEAVPTVLALGISLVRPDLSQVAFRFRYVWGG